MELFDDRVLLVKSSEVIDLYQLEDEGSGNLQNFHFNRLDSAISARLQTNKVKWNKYHTLELKGFVQLT